MPLKYTGDFLRFVNASPSPYHAVQNVVAALKEHNYTEISEKADWTINPGNRYFVKRNDSSIIAFSVGGKWKPGNGMAIIGAHTDSPTLRVKPKSANKYQNYLSVGVETYGGGTWPTWFDRDLSVAGRVYVKEGNQHVSKLLKVDRPLLRIPTVAIHLNRDQGTKLDLNKEDHLVPILGLENDINEKVDGDHGALVQVIADELEVVPESIEDFELVLYDTQPSQVGGLRNEFVFSPRLDNLCSTWCAMQALINSGASLDEDESIRCIALFDHEEIGSQSAHGAASNFLEAIISRLAQPAVFQCLASSFLLSADMAHAVHPNYKSKHDSKHQPLINEGPVIKVNANQRYATNSQGMVLVKEAARLADVQLQPFVVRNDSPCGSTIGPILASRLGIRTLDIGNPQLSMHSIREMAGTKDIDSSVELFTSFLENYTKIDRSIQ